MGWGLKALRESWLRQDFRADRQAVMRGRGSAAVPEARRLMCGGPERQSELTKAQLGFSGSALREDRVHGSRARPHQGQSNASSQEGQGVLEAFGQEKSSLEMNR